MSFFLAQKYLVKIFSRLSAYWISDKKILKIFIKHPAPSPFKPILVRGDGFYTDVEFRFYFLHVKLGSKNIFNIFDLFQEKFSLI